ncbi:MULTISPECIES: cupin domain-containing protein [Pseudomonas]|jgi:uncharacterized cupin superfamily protein|uniref:DUF861 domain-containing protein n=1 Tax=Pseudomonas mosselii TaxID=78327 RepID=A0A5R8ZJ79_9PSED|nr:cupin domain-containing protein [Pseudomonas mosselii]TLP64886.1 DUF861 domain-containing protein [Pseudomonas mosselii]
MQPVVIKAVTDAQFSDALAVAKPVGDGLAHTRTAGQYDLPGVEASTGIWECTPGSFRRALKQAEYSYIISGEGSFTPDGGQPLEFCAGDTLCFPEDCQGTWVVRRTLRKSYVVFG